MTDSDRASPDIHAVLKRLVAGATLSQTEADQVFESLLSGDLDDVQIAGLLSLIQRRGATVDELTGAARVMRRHVTPIEVPDIAGAALIDTCGTGGAPKTFNVSTAAAIIAAAAEPDPQLDVTRVLVAKHGNRSRTGRGSAEVLMQLGVNVDAAPDVQTACLTEAGVCFCFAIHHHPAMRHAGGPRRSLGFPTIFNLLGPLTNPAGATRQMIGVYRPEFVPLVAETLSRLGAERAMVVHGSDGLDELTTTAPSLIGNVDANGIRLDTLDPTDLRIARASLEDLQVGTLEDAAGAIQRIVDGGNGPMTDIAVLSAAAALVIAGAAIDMIAGVQQARSAITTGRARETLDTLIRVSNG